MKAIALLGVCGMAMAGAFRSVNHSNPVLPPIPAPLAVHSLHMWTYSDTLYEGEVLDLHFNTPHAAYLGVVNPSGNFFYVIYPRETASGNLQPLMDGMAFTGCGRLRVNTQALKADPYVYGVYENKPVFTKSGRYRILMGDNLHIDDPALLHKIEVVYIHKPKPAGGA